jgi:ATP-dependent helicase/DNAse subunit B
MTSDPQRLEAALQRLRADVLNYLEFAAGCGSEFAPSDFELRFGGRDDELAAVQIADGLKLQGRIDRIDRAPAGDTAIVYDYKGVVGHPGAGWIEDGRLQLALYMLALPQLLGIEAAGGLYQPLRNDDPRPRGLIRDDVDTDLKTVSTDRVGEAELAAVLEDARTKAVQAVAEIRAGRLSPKPKTCGWKGGGCSYPSICRCGD